MPFIVMCGFPCSGKTTRSKELVNYFENIRHVKTAEVTDQILNVDKNIIYSDTNYEKNLRSTLKSEVQRRINKEDVLILDSMNYIKGFRYELFCVTKSAQTPHCLIHCAVDPAQSAEWNSHRLDYVRYRQDVLDGLVMRFEAPNSQNRWDSPAFTVLPRDELPTEQIYEALFLRKPPPPNLSTLSQPLSSTNFLHELDTITQSIVSAIVEAGKSSVPGDMLTIPGVSDKVQLCRVVTPMELQRIRRQFVVFTKTLTIDDSSKIPNLFVQFLNSRI